MPAPEGSAFCKQPSSCHRRSRIAGKQRTCGLQGREARGPEAYPGTRVMSLRAPALILAARCSRARREPWPPHRPTTWELRMKSSTTCAAALDRGALPAGRAAHRALRPAGCEAPGAGGRHAGREESAAPVLCGEKSLPLPEQLLRLPTAAAEAPGNRGPAEGWPRAAVAAMAAATSLAKCLQGCLQIPSCVSCSRLGYMKHSLALSAEP